VSTLGLNAQSDPARHPHAFLGVGGGHPGCRGLQPENLPFHWTICWAGFDKRNHTSSDGISWTKHAGNPVLTPGGENWNNVCAIHPFVLFESGTYKMWLLTIGDDGGGGISYIAYATSTDGIAWTWHPSNPLFGPTWEDSLWRPYVLQQGGTYQMWYSNHYDGENHTTYATSPDEVSWTKLGSPVLSGTPGEWDEGFASDPSVKYHGSLYTITGAHAISLLPRVTRDLPRVRSSY
jgi:hypothetical protein